MFKVSFYYYFEIISVLFSFFFKAVDYMKENKIDEAIHAFSNAIERQASWAKCFSLRGQCFMKKSNPQRFLFFYN